jgi:hypothetical protein
MTDRALDWEFPGPWPYEGVVLKRDDPEGLARVKLEITGEIDETDWVLPIGMPASGGKGHGAAVAPPIGADVLVWFVGGDRENPRYLTSNYGLGEPPEGTAITNDGDNIVWQDDRVRIEIDSRASTTGIRVTDKATGVGVKLDLNIAARTASLTSDIGLQIKSLGLVEIAGGLITIAGRPVAPGGGPI